MHSRGTSLALLLRREVHFALYSQLELRRRTVLLRRYSTLRHFSDSSVSEFLLFPFWSGGALRRKVFRFGREISRVLQCAHFILTSEKRSCRFSKFRVSHFGLGGFFFFGPIFLFIVYSIWLVLCFFSNS